MREPWTVMRVTVHDSRITHHGPRSTHHGLLMIFQFPDIESLHLALSSGLVTPEIALAAVAASHGPEGSLTIEPSANVTRSGQAALKKLGVQSVSAHAGTTEEYTCWPQILPVAREATVPPLAPQDPVLFELPTAQLPDVVSEMLRLGNDRQSFKFVTSGSEERVLLRVIGPPYYTLLRALEGKADSPVIAYVERAPRVWIEIGHSHPFAAHLKLPDNRMLLIRPPHRWNFVEEGGFQDIYEILEFQLPANSVDYAAMDLPGKLTVPLRLVPGNAADVPEMWVITEDAVDTLDRLVRDADERLMHRLMFAVAQDKGSVSIILRTRPSKLPPPVLEIENSRAFKPYWKLPNLFIPVATRLQPTLRREAVRNLIAEDPAEVVWLMPGEDGRFTPESLPDESFAPLEDWIDYIIDHDREALQAWVQATRFSFKSFLCREDAPDPPKKGPGDGGRKGRGNRTKHSPMPGIFPQSRQASPAGRCNRNRKLTPHRSRRCCRMSGRRSARSWRRHSSKRRVRSTTRNGSISGRTLLAYTPP